MARTAKKNKNLPGFSNVASEEQTEASHALMERIHATKTLDELDAIKFVPRDWHKNCRWQIEKAFQDQRVSLNPNKLYGGPEVVKRALSEIKKAVSIDALLELEDRFLLDESIFMETRNKIRKPLTARIETLLEGSESPSLHPAMLQRMKFFQEKIESLPQEIGGARWDAIMRLEKAIDLAYLPKVLKDAFEDKLGTMKREQPDAVRISGPMNEDGTPKIEIVLPKEESNEVVPPPPFPADTEPTLYTLHAEEIVKILKSSPIDHFKEFAKKLSKYKDPITVLTHAARDREAARHLFKEANLRSFTIKRFLSDTDFDWTARIAFMGTLSHVAHDYRLHFVFDPREHFDKLDKFEAAKKEIQRQPSLMGEIDMERIAAIDSDILDEENYFEQLQKDCPDIILDLETQGSEYSEKGWTIIKFKISAKSVAELNDRRENMKRYRVMLRDITQQ